MILLLLFFSISNLSKGNAIDTICEEYDSLVYHHIGHSYMSQVTTVQNMIWEEYDFLVYHHFEDYDLGRIRSYRARMQTVCILLIFVLICVDMLHKTAS